MGIDTVRMAVRATDSINSGRVRAEQLWVNHDTNGTLQCTLLDRRSSVPLSDARVTCVIGDARIVQLDADARGEFRAEFPQGVYELVISARGELSLIIRGIGVLAGHHQRLTRALVPGDAVPDDQATAAIGGYLIDRLALPVVDAAVTATMAGGSVYTARSDKAGAYVIHAVAPGTYDVVVRAGTRVVSHESVTVAAERTFKRHDLKLVAL